MLLFRFYDKGESSKVFNDTEIFTATTVTKRSQQELLVVIGSRPGVLLVKMEGRRKRAKSTRNKVVGSTRKKKSGLFARKLLRKTKQNRLKLKCFNFTEECMNYAQFQKYNVSKHYQCKLIMFSCLPILTTLPASLRLACLFTFYNSSCEIVVWKRFCDGNDSSYL